MANADQPRGFRPYGKVRHAVKYQSGSTCYPGDFVALASDGQVDPAAAGAVILGLCLSYASASGEDVLVSVDPDQLYVGQADESDLSAQTVVGTLCDIVATAGNSTYKMSRQEIDSSTISDGGGNDTGQLMIVGLEARTGNAWGAQADVIVRINENQLSNQGTADFAGI